METQRSVSLRVPAEAAFARTVRMTAANLAVVMDADLDEVEDLRIAAEEGFVLACATNPDICDVSFSWDDAAMRMSFGLGADDPEASDADLELVEMLLSAVCDSYGVSDDGSTLNLAKHMERHGE